MAYAEARAECERLRRQFAARYGRRYPKAVEALERDWERMVTFYGFPRGHWKHLRTTNVVESPFAAVRLRTDAAKRYRRVASATAVIWKILLVGQSRFRRLDAPELLADSITGSRMAMGVEPRSEKGGSPPDPFYTPLGMSSLSTDKRAKLPGDGMQRATLHAAADSGGSVAEILRWQ